MYPTNKKIISYSRGILKKNNKVKQAITGVFRKLCDLKGNIHPLL